jgi:hypothetical protein
MATIRKRRRNPTPKEIGRQTLSSVGLGLGVASVGLSIGQLYHRPSVSLGGVVLGVGLMAWHLPWSDIMDRRDW